MFIVLSVKPLNMTENILTGQSCGPIKMFYLKIDAKNFRYPSKKFPMSNFRKMVDLSAHPGFCLQVA